MKMPSHSFYAAHAVNERCALCYHRGAEAVSSEAAGFATTLRPILEAENIVGAPDLALHALCMRIGDSVGGAWCAVHLNSPSAAPSSCSPVLCFSIPVRSARVCYESLSAFLRASPSLDAQVYRTPLQFAHPQADAFWAETTKGAAASAYGGKAAAATPATATGSVGERTAAGGQSDWSSEYTIYRRVIDGLIESAAHEHLLGGRPLNVLEICGGDGSLAERLLERFDTSIGSYTLLERNETLVGEATARLARFGQRAVVLQADATSAAAYVSCDLVVSSGSILCGQVGSALDAEATLGHVASSLVDGGHVIATGFSTSFLHPALLQRAGFEVVHGSLPAAQHQQPGQVGPPAHGFGRFQMFVLRRGRCGGGGVEGACLFDAVAGG